MQKTIQLTELEFNYPGNAMGIRDRTDFVDDPDAMGDVALMVIRQVVYEQVVEIEILGHGCPRRDPQSFL